MTVQGTSHKNETDKSYFVEKKSRIFLLARNYRFKCEGLRELLWYKARDADASRASRVLVAQDAFFFFLLLSVLRWQWEMEAKSSWSAMPDAAGAKQGTRIRHALLAAGNSGAFGLSPTKSLKYASYGTMPHVL